jgi:hypothetical protein
VGELALLGADRRVVLCEQRLCRRFRSGLVVHQGAAFFASAAAARGGGRFSCGKEAAPVLAETNDIPTKPFLPVLPLEGMLKKVELAVQTTSEFPPPVVQIFVRTERAISLPENQRAASPHELRRRF